MWHLSIFQLAASLFQLLVKSILLSSIGFFFLILFDFLLIFSCITFLIHNGEDSQFPFNIREKIHFQFFYFFRAIGKNGDGGGKHCDNVVLPRWNDFQYGMLFLFSCWHRIRKISCNVQHTHTVWMALNGIDLFGVDNIYEMWIKEDKKMCEHFQHKALSRMSNTCTLEKWLGLKWMWGDHHRQATSEIFHANKLIDWTMSLHTVVSIFIRKEVMR